MSISISAYTGFYVKAKRPNISGSVLVSACPKHGEMDVVYCPTCGLHTVPQAKFVESTRSISEIILAPETDWVREMISEEDAEWIRQNVSVVDPYFFNDEEDYDYFLIGDAWNGDVQDIDLAEDVCKPEQEDVVRVLKIMGYLSHSMHFETLVLVSN